MQRINLFFSILFIGFISLFTFNYSNAETKSINDNESKTHSIVVITKKDDPISEIDVDPMSLLKGGLLSELLLGEMNGMRLGMDGSEAILYTMYDMDEDGDKDLFMQVLFERGEVVQDAFVIYYNNGIPAVDSNFKPGFSADNYHKLGSQGGEARPCIICLFEKVEDNVFIFKDRADLSPLKFKLGHEEYIGLTWEKQ